MTNPTNRIKIGCDKRVFCERRADDYICGDISFSNEILLCPICKAKKETLAEVKKIINIWWDETSEKVQYHDNEITDIDIQILLKKLGVQNEN